MSEISAKIYDKFNVFKRILPKLLKYAEKVTSMKDLSDDLTQVDRIIKRLKTANDEDIEIVRLKDISEKFERIEYIFRNYEEDKDIKRLSSNKKKQDELTSLSMEIRNKIISLMIHLDMTPVTPRAKAGSDDRDEVAKRASGEFTSEGLNRTSSSLQMQAPIQQPPMYNQPQPSMAQFAPSRQIMYSANTCGQCGLLMESSSECTCCSCLTCLCYLVLLPPLICCCIPKDQMMKCKNGHKYKIGEVKRCFLC